MYKNITTVSLGLEPDLETYSFFSDELEIDPLYVFFLKVKPFKYIF